MSVLFLLVPVVLLVVLAAVLTFVWAVRRGQFDDLTTPSLRALRDDEPPPPETPARGAPPNQGEAAPPPER